MESLRALFKLMNPESDWWKVPLENVDGASPDLNAYFACHLILKATKIDVKEPDNAIILDGEKKLVDILNEFVVPYNEHDVSIKESFAKNIRIFVYVHSNLMTEVGEMASKIQLQGLLVAIIGIVLLYSHELQIAVIPSKRSYEEVISEERLSEFNRQWNLCPIILLRSPPASGKTTFVKWVELHNKNKGRVVRRISMTDMVIVSGYMENNESFDSFWKEQVGETWTNCLQCKTPTDVLINEAQILYAKATFFWTAIKSLQDRPNSNLRVMLFSMYSDCLTINEGSHYIPVEFGHALGMEQLCLKRNEYDELVEKFNKFIYENEHFKLTIPEEVGNAIFNATEGHPHLVRNRYFTAIEHTRVFDWVMNLELTNDNYNFLRNTYYKVDANSTLLSIHLMKLQGNSSVQDFDSFLLLSIERMRPLTLAKSLSHHNKVNARLIERQWQTEWLIAAMTAVPSGSSIRPDVGPVYGTQDYLGFYIDGDLNWGVELMMEGKRMADHIYRFGSEGRYKSIPFDRWAIIDFRHNSTISEKLVSNVWHVLYADDYKTIIVRR
ncbi:38936_t:CDS:2 [Gigaspora margarita]|uniref:38936_t:CDS:1 n=1 Tax=Gigaspora margarita TaxID=4874 RepID=A0ABN7UBM8_GIGMA|nr:38936_t:CDS:2 [Gigaspora margarita]